MMLPARIAAIVTGMERHSFMRYVAMIEEKALAQNGAAG